MELLKKLRNKIKNPPKIIQFAKDGKYEEAWIIEINEEKPSKEIISEYINKDKYENLIVEYVWNPEKDEERYVLTVIQDESCKEQGKNEFINKCLSYFYERLTFGDLIGTLDKEIVGKDFLFRQPVQKVRLGVFNNWFSVGPIEIWDRGEEFNEERIVNKIHSRPEVKKSKLNYQGLAFIYNFDGSLSGPYHVLKTPTCGKKGETWEVDIPLVVNTVRDFISR